MTNIDPAAYGAPAAAPAPRARNVPGLIAILLVAVNLLLSALSRYLPSVLYSLDASMAVLGVLNVAGLVLLLASTALAIVGVMNRRASRTLASIALGASALGLLDYALYSGIFPLLVPVLG